MLSGDDAADCSTPLSMRRERVYKIVSHTKTITPVRTTAVMMAMRLRTLSGFAFKCSRILGI